MFVCLQIPSINPRIRSALSQIKVLQTQCPLPLSAGGGGAEKFSMLAKREGLALFEFLGGGVSKKGGVDFSGGPEDFLKVIFNC